MQSSDNHYHTLKLTSKKEVNEIKSNNDNYNYGSFTCLGGGSFHKGLSVGMQDKMVPGLIVYDEENFYGFSEKNGLNLLSHNNDYKELEFPILDKQFQDQKKDLNIDLTCVDLNNYYIIIPKSIDEYNIKLNLNITFIYNDESIINELQLNIINPNKQNINIQLKNKNAYYSLTKKDLTYNHSSILKFNVNFINNDYSLINVTKFDKHL